jgi:hypothetical protein
MRLGLCSNELIRVEIHARAEKSHKFDALVRLSMEKDVGSHWKAANFLSEFWSQPPGLRRVQQQSEKGADTLGQPIRSLRIIRGDK